MAKMMGDYAPGYKVEVVPTPRLQAMELAVELLKQNPIWTHPIMRIVPTGTPTPVQDSLLEELADRIYAWING